MISLNDFQNLIATTFLDGNMAIAGMLLYAIVLMVVFGLTKNVFQSLLVGMVATMIFSALGILNTELTVLLIIVSVLGLAYTSRGVWRD